MDWAWYTHSLLISEILDNLWISNLRERYRSRPWPGQVSTKLRWKVLRAYHECLTWDNLQIIVDTVTSCQNYNEVYRQVITGVNRITIKKSINDTSNLTTASRKGVPFSQLWSLSCPTRAALDSGRSFRISVSSGRQTTSTGRLGNPDTSKFIRSVKLCSTIDSFNLFKLSIPPKSSNLIEQFDLVDLCCASTWKLSSNYRPWSAIQVKPGTWYGDPSSANLFTLIAAYQTKDPRPKAIQTLGVHIKYLQKANNSSPASQDTFLGPATYCV